MRTVRFAEDIIPVSEFKAQAADFLKRIAETGQPLVITQNGKAAAVVLSPAEFDRLTERDRLIAAVEEGLAQADAGQLVEHEEVVARIKKRFAGRRTLKGA